MQSIIRNRQFYVRRLDRLIAELEAVRGSDDPKTTLTHHAEHFARLEKSGLQTDQVTESPGVRVISTIAPLASDLKETASHLSGLAAADRAALANDISNFRALQEFIVARSKLSVHDPAHE
jgi:hypothetical protein